VPTWVLLLHPVKVRTKPVIKIDPRQKRFNMLLSSRFPTWIRLARGCGPGFPMI
jgi:hypothetical protein